MQPHSTIHIQGLPAHAYMLTSIWCSSLTYACHHSCICPLWPICQACKAVLPGRAWCRTAAQDHSIVHALLEKQRGCCHRALCSATNW